ASWVRACWAVSSGPLPPFGSRCSQALSAAGNRGLLAASWCTVSLRLRPPTRCGSGKLGTPWERMQREKATSCGVAFCVVVVAARREEGRLATLQEPPLAQPAASSENEATATIEVRISARRQPMRSVPFSREQAKAHHRNLNVLALRLRGC